MRNFTLDLVRILRRRFCENFLRVGFEFIVTPTLVAGVIAFAFILRYTSVEHREGLAFFATLYAFWCGLFGSCQSINSEVNSGEWSYWVLGMRRNFFTHLVAHITASIITAFLQVTMCVFALLVINVLTGNLVMQNLFNIYFSTNVLFADVMQACSSFWWITETAHYSGLWILYFAMIAALISGVGFGILFSALFKEPITSLNVSVAFIVILSILSYTTLHDPNRTDRYYNAPGETPRCFMPLYLTLHQEKTSVNVAPRSDLDLGKRRDADFLETISYALPQRYFFNIARLTFGKVPYLGKTCRKTHKDSESPQNTICRCAQCLGISKEDGLWAERYFSEKHIGDIATFNPTSEWRNDLREAVESKEYESGIDVKRFYERYGGLCKSNIWGVQSLFALFRKIVFFETVALLFIFLLTITGAYLCIKNKEVYYVLR